MRILTDDPLRGIIRLLFYPLIIFSTNIYRLFETWSSLSSSLRSERWQSLCFSVRTGLSYLFYDIQALNLEYFGRNGVSTLLGFGDYALSKWFIHSKVGLILTKKGKPLIVPVSMLLWLSTHALWIQDNNLWLVLALLFMILVSSTFIHQSFTAQNYNVLGWIFFPIFLWGLMKGNIPVICVSAALSAVFSITAYAVGIPFAIVMCWVNNSFTPLFAVLCGGLVILFQFLQAPDLANLKNTILNISQRITGSRKANAYTRTTSKGLKTGITYFMVVFLIFLTTTIFQTRSLPWQGLTALIILLINTFIFRFADTQSMQIMLMSVGFALAVDNPTLLQIFLFWLMISPPAFIFYGTQNKKDLIVMPARKLKSIQPILNNMNEFLSEVKEKEIVFFAFDDPKGIYENIFDGYRWLIEVPAYIATMRNFLFLPTWWTVFEAMERNMPPLWGRSVSAVSRNVAQLKADYVMVYQEKNTILDDKWAANGYEQLSSFSWKDFQDLLTQEKVILKDLPVWFLLKKA